MALHRLLVLVPLFALVAACGNDLPPEEIIEKPRPLASMITISGDTTHRATPKPGETATFEMLVVNPGPRVGWAYAFVVCPYATNSVGVGFCDTSLGWWEIATQIVTVAPVAPPFPDPSITFTVPDDATLGPDRNSLLVEGVMCPGDLDPSVFTALASGDLNALRNVPNPCTDKAENGLFVSSTIALERMPIDENHTPYIVGTTFDSRTWTEEASDLTPKADCANMGHFEVKETSAFYTISLALDPASFETYLAPSLISGDPPTMETDDPRVVAYADGGDYDVRVDNQRSPGQVLNVTWQPPQPSVPEKGTLVRFWFLVHDVRSQPTLDATSWVTRELCVVP